MVQLPNEIVDTIAQTRSPQELLLLHLMLDRPLCSIARKASDAGSKFASTHLKAFPCEFCVPEAASPSLVSGGPAESTTSASASPQRLIKNWPAFYQSRLINEVKQEKSADAKWARRREEVLREHAARIDQPDWMTQDRMGWESWNDTGDEVVLRERRQRQYLALRRAFANCMQQEWGGDDRTRLAVFDAYMRVPSHYGTAAMARIAAALGISDAAAFRHRNGAFDDLKRRLAEQCQQGTITATELRSFGFDKTR